MSRIDPSTPAWMLDVADNVMGDLYSRLAEGMLSRDEDMTDDALWILRRNQLDDLIAVRLARTTR